MARNRLNDVVHCPPSFPLRAALLSASHPLTEYRYIESHIWVCLDQLILDILTLRSDAPAPAQAAQPAYPPPSNAVAAQTRGPNPYAQQNVAAAPGPGNYNSYAAQNAPNVSQYAGPQGGAAPQGYGANAGNPYAQQQYGQQDQYANRSNGAGAGATGHDFWGELSATNSALSTLQEEIQAVRTAHQQSLVSGCSHRETRR